MTINKNFDVIIIGGSFAGLSAAMALGRALRNVLIIDNGRPCNQQTPHSHNFITHDGEIPFEIISKAKEQVLRYDTVKFYDGLATDGIQAKDGFEIKTDKGDTFTAKKLLFTTGITDLHAIKGSAECWGISVLHCPYCHGYEVRDEKIGVLANGDLGFEFVRHISNWTKQLTLFTNGKSTLSDEQAEKLKKHNIKIVETEIEEFEHSKGNIRCILFKDNTKVEVIALFIRLPFRQHSTIPERLDCEMTEQGYIKVDEFQKTTVRGVYAAGDNSSIFRAVSAAIASGNKAGAMLNKEMIEENF